jgi:hypothetical protein
MSSNESNTAGQMILNALSAGTAGSGQPFELKDGQCRELKFAYFTKFPFGVSK